MVTLYKWQEECLEEWKKVSHRGVIEVTTGSGKTLLAAVCAIRRSEEVSGNIRTYVVVPRVPLLEQWRKTLEYAGIKNAVVQNRGKIVEAQTSIFTINRARDRLPLIIENDMKNGINVLLILDEFHHYGSPSNYHLFDFFDSPSYDSSLYSSLGLSATAEVSTLTSKLIPAIGPLFYTYELKTALRDKVVNDFVLFNIAVDLNEDERFEYDELTEKITKMVLVLQSKAPSVVKKSRTLEEFISNINKTGDKSLVELAFALKSLVLARRAVIATADARIKTVPLILETLRKEDRVLIFTERIVQVEKLNCILSDMGYKCLRYTSEMDKSERSRSLNAFKEGEVSILIACKALDEGLDVPDCNVGIFLANSSTKLQRIQRSGRIIRRGKDKLPSVLYYIYCDNTVESDTLLPFLNEDIAVTEAKVISSGEIYNQKYYERILTLLEKLRKDRMTEKTRSELVPLINYGNIRPEQFMSKEELEAMKMNTRDSFFRSYLSLMIVLSTISPYEREEKKDEKANCFL